MPDEITAVITLGGVELKIYPSSYDIDFPTIRVSKHECIGDKTTYQKFGTSYGDGEISFSGIALITDINGENGLRTICKSGELDLDDYLGNSFKVIIKSFKIKPIFPVTTHVEYSISCYGTEIDKVDE